MYYSNFNRTSATICRKKSTIFCQILTENDAMPAEIKYSGYKRGLSVRINAIFCCCALFGVQINSMFYAYFGTVAIRLGSIPFQENLLVGHGLRVLKNVTQYSQFELLSLSRIVEHYVLIKKQFVTFSENLDRCTGSFIF